MKKTVNLFSAAVFLSLSVQPASYAALPSSAEIKHKSRDLNKVQEELSQKKREQEQLKKEASQISKSLEAGETKMKGVEEALVHTKKKNVEVEMDLAQTKNSRDRVSKEIQDTKSAVRGAFGVHYVTASLIGPSAPTPVFSRALYQSTLNKLDDLKQSKEKSQQDYEELTQTYEVLQREYQSQQQKLTQLKSGRANQERLLQKKMTRRQILEEEAKDLQKTAEELASMIDILRTQAKKEQSAEKKERHQKIVTGQSPISRNSLPWPLQGKIVKRFGRQKQGETSSLYISNGIVIQSSLSSSVQAVADGQVLYAGNFMSYGPMTVVEHSGDWYTVYGQLSKWSVQKGQMVRKGDVVGETGVSDLGKQESYFELRFYGKPVDPMPWLAD